MRLLLAVSILCLLSISSGAAEFQTRAKFAIAVDNTTNTVLFDKLADEKMHPSSMTKLMTLYVLFDQLKSNKINLDTKFKVSEKAWKTGGSKMFVHVGDEVRVEDLLRGIIVQSGNDACTVVAENISGSEENFAAEMNKYAQKLGLNGSHFMNSTGLPDPEHLMTARDLELIGRKLIEDFPEYYHYFAEHEFAYNKIKQPNRNLLLYRNVGVDGLKTGHTEEAGYGIVASAIREGRRITVVVNGLKSEKERADVAQEILDYGFREYKKVKLFNPDEIIETAPVWFGKKESVGLIANREVAYTINNSDIGKITAEVSYDSPIPAPIKKGDKVGEVVIKKGEATLNSIPVFAAEDVEKLGWFKHLARAAKYHLTGK